MTMESDDDTCDMPTSLFEYCHAAPSGVANGAAFDIPNRVIPSERIRLGGFARRGSPQDGDVRVSNEEDE